MVPEHGEASATPTTRVATLQTWLMWALPAACFAAVGIDIVGNRLSVRGIEFVSPFLIGAAFLLAGPAWAYLIYRYPHQLDGSTKAAVERVGMPRLYALAMTWLSVWGAAFWIILGVTELAGQEIADDVLIYLTIIALLPLIALETVAWIRHRPERRRARAEAAQARAAWIVMNMRAATTEQPSREHSRWRDRWRNRVRRAQSRRTRG